MLGIVGHRLSPADDWYTQREKLIHQAVRNSRQSRPSTQAAINWRAIESGGGKR